VPIARAGTEVDAINLALSLLREEEIADVAEETKPAREARKWFGTARDETLRENDWNFAEAWSTPAADPSTNPGPLASRYPLPADCLKVRSVEGLVADEWKVLTIAIGTPTPVETNVLVTNAVAPVVCYTRRITDVALWDPQFLVAFTRRLAGYMAAAFGKSIDEADGMEKASQRKVDAAARQDARERAPSQIPSDVPFLRARRGWRKPW
jgi:hypothetical protein